MKIAFAEVVSLFETEKRTTVAAYATAARSTGRPGRVRAARNAANTNRPASRERPDAICQPERPVSFMAARAVGGVAQFRVPARATGAGGRDEQPSPPERPLSSRWSEMLAPDALPAD